MIRQLGEPKDKIREVRLEVDDTQSLNDSHLFRIYRETLLQALRGVITPAGDKMTLPLRKQVYSTLLNLLSHPEDVTRSAAAGCLGALCKYLPPEMLATTLTDHLLRELNRRINKKLIGGLLITARTLI